jgi:hypothetical protein
MTVPSCAVMAMCALASWSALAKNLTVVRVTSGEHPYFGRVVLDAPDLAYTVSRDGGHVLIRFSGEAVLGELPPTPRNVLAIRPAQGGMELTVPPGANVHTARMGSKIIIDIDDTVPNRPAVPPPREAPKDSATVPPGSVGSPRQEPPPGQTPPGQAVAGPPARSPLPAAHLVNGQPASQNLVANGAHGDEPLPPRPTEVPTVVSPRDRPAPPQANASSGPAAPVPALGPRTATAGRVGPEPPAAPNTGPAGQPGQAPGDPPAARVVPVAAARHDDAPSESGPARPNLGIPGTGQPAPAAANATPVAALPAGLSGESANVPTPPPTTVAPDPSSGSPPPGPTPGATPAGHPDEAHTDQSPTPTGPLQVWPVTRDAVPLGPVALVAIRMQPPNGLAGAAVLIPFGEPVGAALFSRGPDTLVVFDERRPIDLAALRDDPVFGSAVVTIYPTATVIHLIRPPGQSALLTPASTGWRVSMVPATPLPTPLAPVVGPDGLVFPADAPGQIVTISDPRTGGTLLVGTQRVSGQGVLSERRTPEFELPVTGQGIVVEALSDAISLRITQTGFVLSGARTGLKLSPPLPMAEATMAAARLTRLFDFPRQTTQSIARRAKWQAVVAATAPLQQRGPKRHALAESMIGLGLGAEAATVLHVAMKDDPREAAAPTTIGLAAIAALLAGRPGEAGDLADPRLTGTDEIAMWRALATAMADDASPAAASILATTAPLLFTYPPELRARVLPLALETMVRGGQAEAAAPLLAQREHDQRLDYARALLKQAQGDNAGALNLFDALVDSRSDRDHARAGVRAAELRLATGQLDTKAAADALEKQLYAWRGDGRELALRLRVAELRQDIGAWRSVFATLRAARADFPAQAAEIDRRLKQAFAAVARDPALDKMEPTELIALLDENAELMAEGPEGEPMRILLAEKLMALDLPKRADPLLTKLMRAAPYGAARAGFGATLATLRLREGDGDGAMLALSESNSADMGDAVRDRRALIAARVEAKRGDLPGAVEALSAAHTQDADEERAAILERAQDWPGARDALTILAARVVPDPCVSPCGPLDNAQLGIVLRLTTAATRAGDDATLAALRERLSTRIGAGPQGDMFRLLTAQPVRGTADLGRARAEMGFARSVAADMGPKKPAARTP